MTYMTEIEGVPNKTDIREGMAYFSNTGPFGTFCGGCAHRGYYKKQERFNKTTGEWETKNTRTSGCALFHKMAGKHGPAVNEKWCSCKYFEPKPPEKTP